MNYMNHITFVCNIRAPLEKVWEFHETIDALPILTPPYMKMTVEGVPEAPRKGARYPFRIRRNGLTMHWLAEYTRFDPPHGFTDFQVKGPFAYWEHRHDFEATPEGTRLTDSITYKPPFGIFGWLADRLVLRADIAKMFAYRHRVTKERLEGETGRG